MKEIFSKLLSFGKWTIILVIVLELTLLFVGTPKIIDWLEDLFGQNVPEEQQGPVTATDDDGCILIIGPTGKNSKVCP